MAGSVARKVGDGAGIGRRVLAGGIAGVLVTAGLVLGVGTVPAGASTAITLFSSSTPGLHTTSAVPADVCFVNVSATGGHGGAGYLTATNTAPGKGAPGASVTATVPVAPGTGLSVMVGGAGGTAQAHAGGAGGVGGGGGGGLSLSTNATFDYAAGGGGGASSVAQGPTPLVVSGGGGGGGGANLTGGGAGGSGGLLGAAGGTGAGNPTAKASTLALGGSASGAGGAGGTFRTTFTSTAGGGGGGVAAGGTASSGAGAGGAGSNGTGGGGGGGQGNVTRTGGTGLPGGSGGSGTGVAGSNNGVLGGAGGAGSGKGGNGGTAGRSTLTEGGGGGGGGGVGFSGGGGGSKAGGGGGGGYGGGGGGGFFNGGGGGSSFAVPAALSTSSAISSRSGAGLVAITYNATADACPHFTLSAPSPATAGVAVDVQVKAMLAGGTVDTGYSGTVHFTSSDPTATLPADTTLATGAGTFPVTFATAGTQTVAATDTAIGAITGSSGTVKVLPGPATHLSVVAPNNAVAGTAISVTVKALDKEGNVATGFSGTVHFTSTDTKATLPANTKLSTGVVMLGATLATAGTQTISATDLTTGLVTGASGGIVVSPAPVTHFAVVAATPVGAGIAEPVTVTARDRFGNLVPSFSGTVAFSSTDTRATLPGTSALATGTFTGTVTFHTAGTQTVTATYTVSTAVTGTSGKVLVTPGAATHLGVTAPSSATAGVPANVAVTAYDTWGNVATGFAGTVGITSSDASATLPAPAKLATGTGTFTVTLATAGHQTVTGTDATTPLIKGTSGQITVYPSAPTHFTLTAPATATAGSPVSVTLTARDRLNNVVSTFAGTVTLGSTDRRATIPGSITVATGTASFAATFRTAGHQTLTATDTATPGITGVSGPVTVAPGPTTSLAVAGPSVAEAGSPASFTVTAQDRFGNVATGFSGSVGLSSSDPAAVLPPAAVLVTGQGTFPVTLETSGVQHVVAADTATPAITGRSGAVTVSAATASRLEVHASASDVVGHEIGVTVVATDRFGNVVPTFTGTVRFTSNDYYAGLPADTQLVTGSVTRPVTLWSPGTRTVTVTDLGTPALSGVSGPIAVSPTTNNVSYRLSSANGATAHFDASAMATTGPVATSAPVVGQAAQPGVGTSGFWLVGSDGSVYPEDGAPTYGSLPKEGIVPAAPVVAIIPTPDGGGYWLVGTDGGVYAFGDAPFPGSLPGLSLKVGDIVGGAANPVGPGLWLVGADGGVFALGGAPFLGSLPGSGTAVGDVIGIAAPPAGGGYWLAGADGGVFALGGAPFLGSLPGTLPPGRSLHAPVTALAAAPGGGYWLFAADGGVFALGGAPFFGSLPGSGTTLGRGVRLHR